jgi:hypothetical protein
VARVPRTDFDFPHLALHPGILPGTLLLLDVPLGSQLKGRVVCAPSLQKVACGAPASCAALCLFELGLLLLPLLF